MEEICNNKIKTGVVTYTINFIADEYNYSIFNLILLSIQNFFSYSLLFSQQIAIYLYFFLTTIFIQGLFNSINITDNLLDLFKSFFGIPKFIQIMILICVYFGPLIYRFYKLYYIQIPITIQEFPILQKIEYSEDKNNWLELNHIKSYSLIEDIALIY